MNEHLDEIAELYALGSLDDAVRERADLHAQTCAQCRARLGQAEAAVAAMLKLEPQHHAPVALRERLRSALEVGRTASRSVPSRRGGMSAVAAAVVILLLPLGYVVRQNMAMHGAMSANAAVMARLADPSTSHVAFAPMHGAPISARVYYSGAGDWYCVLVAHPQHPLQVAYVRDDGSMETIGNVSMDATGMAVMPIHHQMRKLALLDGNTVVAEAELSFS
jgi:hypothetical protein